MKLTWSSEHTKIILVNETLDLCDLMADIGISCPLSKHTVLMAHYHDHFPSIFPKVSEHNVVHMHNDVKSI